MRPVAVLLFLAATSVTAQQPPRTPAESAHADSAPPPPPPLPPPVPSPPTLEQEHYLLGLRTVGRGIAQLKDGIERVARTQAVSDSVRQRQAGRRLAGLCAAARGFLTSGRAPMRPTVYEEPTRTPARTLSVQVDSVIAYIPRCEAGAGKTPKKTATELTAKLMGYEAALRDFRTAIGLPNKSDTVPKHRGDR